MLFIAASYSFINSQFVRFASETSELGLGGLRDHVVGAVRKYTQLWVSALLKETTYRIDLAMTEHTPLSSPSFNNSAQQPSTIGSAAAGARQFTTADFFTDEGIKLPFSASDVTEAVPALLSSFVRTVKQFENNKQIVSIADIVERRCLGNYQRGQLQTGTLGSTVPMPMLTYQASNTCEFYIHLCSNVVEH